MSQRKPPQEQINDILNLFKGNQIQQALDFIDTLSKDYPDNSLLFNIRGACYAALNQPEEAIKNYKDALAIKPNYSDASYNLGNVLKDLGHLDEAVKSYKKTIAIEPATMRVFKSSLNEFLPLLFETLIN